MKKILFPVTILFLCLFPSILYAKKYVVIYPHGNSLAIVWHNKSGSSTPPYVFAPHIWNGQAFRFATIITEDTVGIAKRYPAHSRPNPKPEVMELIGIWNLPDTPTKNTDEDSFGKFVEKLIGKEFRTGKVKYIGDKPHDNITPYCYNGKHCMLLWDDPAKCVEQGEADHYLYWNIFDFDYSLCDAKQIALCRLTDEQYVLLLLTEAVKYEKNPS